MNTSKFTYAVILENGVYRPYAVENDKPLFGTLVETIGVQNESNWALACLKAKLLNNEQELRMLIIEREEYKKVLNHIALNCNTITRITVERQLLSHSENIEDKTGIVVFTQENNVSFEPTACWEV